ncbi:hypothetical protein LWI28_012429 [Acer negundo]|uniref:Uncharacterized protein n=1 Tax=Acer negundo TaxID=4023 RepID=A0AAD5P1T3_ACENE|nr:hypothetical protein LWI28_012429 [Acer negundo]KAK4856698.1 hypothetical protein QYF36_020209 [Acer negundo]
MEALKQIACVSGAGMDTQHRCQSFSNQGRVFMMMNKGRADYCCDDLARKKNKKEKGAIKKKLKLLKGLSKDLSTFSGMGFTVDNNNDLRAQVQGQMITEAAETLLKQLEQVRAEEKELKRKRKQEKAKLKSQIPSLESIDSEPESQEEETVPCEENKENDFQGRSSQLQIQKEETTTSCNDDKKRIQVCMGGKCKKSGGGALLEEFQRLMGVEGAVDVEVVGCKCMGKCKNAPNVKLSNSVDDTPANPLFIGVGLEDVGGIVANFLAQQTTITNDLDLNLASL